MVTLFIVIGLALAVSFLSSILEAVLLSLTHSYVLVMQEKNEPAGKILAHLQENIDKPIAAILTLNTISHTVGAALGGAIALQVFGEKWMALFSALLTLAILIVAEIIPKTVGATYWQFLAKPTAYVLKVMVYVMYPIITPLSWINRLITPIGAKVPTVSRAELEVMAEIGRREGTIDQEEWEVVSNVMNLDQITVAEIMTPRINMVTIPISSTVTEAKSKMLDEGHFRLPVYDGSVDNIVGVLLARDLWKADTHNVVELAGIIRQPQFVPQTKSVENLIREMRREKVKMAIVLDEFGGTSGLVTLEDLLEEIVGEIQDEHEHEPLSFEEARGETRIGGNVPVWEVNERFLLSLPDDIYDTLGGFIFGALGRIAIEGDEICVDGGNFRVLHMEGRRVERVSFVPSPIGTEDVPHSNISQFPDMHSK